MNRKLLCLTVLASVTFSSLSLHAQVKGDPEANGTTPILIPPKTSSKLSPELKRLYDDRGARAKVVQSTRKPTLPEDAMNAYLQIKGDKIVVDVTVKGDAQATRTELQKMGFEFKAAYGRVISGLMPINSLPQMESASTIRFVKPAYKPLHVTQPVNTLGYLPKPKPAPPVGDQGDTAQRSTLARKKYKVDGSGVMVGILSNSYNNLGGAAKGVAAGELPGPGNPFGYRKPVRVLKDLDSGGDDEGRAMAEILHDVAPGAQLAFHTANDGQADFAQGIIKLADAGCDVITDDVLYYAEPYFQDGIIAQAVDQVKSRGVTYFSAAGNSSIRSYESEYRPTTVEPLGPGNGTAHNFSGPGTPARYFQPIYIPPGGSIISSFQWDQSSFSASGVGCTTDFDIYLLNSDLQVVAGGTSNNILSGDPIEVFGYFNNTNNPTFYLLIVKFTGPDVTRLKYILYNDALFYLTKNPIPGILSPTLVGHAKADGAIATAAAYYLETPAYGVDTPRVEGFSSRGGVANYYDISGNRIAPLIRKKPDITAPDGANTSFFGQVLPQAKDTLPHFFGTSAAAPHAAGVAALMIDAQKLHTLKPAQIKGILGAHAVDMDDPYTDGFDKGFDFATGAGFITADKSVGDVKFPHLFVKNLEIEPLCSDDPTHTRNWKIVNPNPFEVNVDWILIGSNQHGSLLAQPGETTFSTDALSIKNIPLPSIAIIDWEDNFGFTRLDLAYGSGAKCGKDVVSAANSDKLIGGETARMMTPTDKPLNVAEVYPNPSPNTFRLYLSLAGQQQTRLGLYSADGRQLQVRLVAQPSGVIDIDAGSYKPGVYFLKVEQGGFTKTIKLIKQ
ncbi:MAG: S8 family serine peptidase [Chitinophagaceae bacterium]|nr:S8 family serine peptidase [Chitinophagaceae bacterium]